MEELFHHHIHRNREIDGDPGEEAVVGERNQRWKCHSISDSNDQSRGGDSNAALADHLVALNI